MDNEVGIGHNSDDSSAKRLRSFIERVERMNEEIAELTEDRKEIYAEAKATGFEPKIMRKIVALRKMDPDKRAEERAILETYLSALGE